MEERKELVNRLVLPHNGTPPSARSDAPADAAVDSVSANDTAQPLRLRYAKPCNGCLYGRLWRPGMLGRMACVE